MAKDFKEKFEKVCTIKDRALSLVDMQLNGNIENVDAKELGEVADIAKDMAEIMKLCIEAEYYFKITEAMDENSNERNMQQIERYIPENKRWYTPVWDEPVERPWNDWDMNPRKNHKQYYYTDFGGSSNGNMMNTSNRDSSNMRNTSRNMDNQMDMTRDDREGRAGITRRTYMDMKENKSVSSQQKLKEMEKYIHDLADDINEMIEGMDANEKSSVKNKLTQLATKIV